uniref:Uncharacterized protein n=1 Tax=Arundo donax TaxID=35708 RepID=A0A0A9AFQ8_ARUDO
MQLIYCSYQKKEMPATLASATSSTKFVAKTLPDCMKHHFHAYIYKSQHTFIQGRWITNIIILA